MADGETYGMLLAAALAALCFGVSRWAVRYFTRRRAERAAAAAALNDSRQVRRAKARSRR